MTRRFWISVASVLSGSAIAQAIPIAGSLVLTRLFLPAAYGGYSVWLGVVLIMAVVSTLRLEMALAVIPDGAERHKALGQTLATVIVIASAAAVVAVPVWLSGVLPASFASPFVIAGALLAAGLAASCDTWQAMAAAEGTYPFLIKLRIAQATLIVLTQLGASLISRDAEALMAGHIAGLAATLAIAFWAGARPSVRFAGLFDFWRSQARFPLFALPADSINSLSAQLPLLVVSARFGNHAAGILALTMRVLGLPISLLGRAVLDVFRRHAAEAFRERGELTAEYLSTLKVLGAGSVVFAVCTYFLAEPIFTTAFGTQWRAAGTIAIWLAPLFALRFMASPLSYVFYIVGRQNIDLIWQIGLLCVVFATLLLPPDVRTSILAYGWAYSAMYLIYLVLSYRCSKGKHR